MLALLILACHGMNPLASTPPGSPHELVPCRFGPTVGSPGSTVKAEEEPSTSPPRARGPIAVWCSGAGAGGTLDIRSEDPRLARAPFPAPSRTCGLAVGAVTLDVRRERPTLHTPREQGLHRVLDLSFALRSMMRATGRYLIRLSGRATHRTSPSDRQTAEAQRRTMNRVPGHAGGSPRSLAGSEQRTRDRGERRFEAEQSNERWQADITHWRLAGGTDVGILNVLDDQLALELVPHVGVLDREHREADVLLEARRALVTRLLRRSPPQDRPLVRQPDELRPVPPPAREGPR